MYLYLQIKNNMLFKRSSVLMFLSVSHDVQFHTLCWTEAQLCTREISFHTFCIFLYKTSYIHISTAPDKLQLPLEEWSSTGSKQFHQRLSPNPIYLALEPQGSLDFPDVPCLINCPFHMLFEGIRSWGIFSILRLWVNNCFLTSITLLCVDVRWYNKTTSLDLL